MVKPLTAAEVAQINDLVKQAMGYSQARGDTLNVANAAFDGVDKPDEQGAGLVEGPGQPAAGQGHRAYVFIALVLAFLWFRFVRPLLKPAIKQVRRGGGDAARAGTGRAGAGTGAGPDADALRRAPSAEEQEQQVHGLQEQPGNGQEPGASTIRASWPT